MEKYGHDFDRNLCIFCGMNIWGAAVWSSYGTCYGCSSDEIIEQLVCEAVAGFSSIGKWELWRP